MDEIENKIVAFLQTLPTTAREEGWEWKRGNWTKAIKKALYDIGHEHGYSVGANQCEVCDDQEWLFDMTWWKSDGSFLKSVPLVMESEWSPDPVMDGDFQKLLVCKAIYRVWIFENKTFEDIYSDFDRYIEQIKAFDGVLSGDRFLLAGVGWNPRKFVFKHYVHGLFALHA